MTLASGADVAIGTNEAGDPVEYMLAQSIPNHYVHRYESLFSNATAIAGEIAKQQLRPEKMLWSWTDMSGGEGSPIYYPQDPTAYDIGDGVNVTNAGLVTTRPRRRVTSVARSGSTSTTAMRPAGGSTWDKAIILWGENGIFSKDAVGWTAGTGVTANAGANVYDCDSDGRFMVSGIVQEGNATGNILYSVDGSPATPTYADIFTGTTLLDAPFVTEVLNGVWYAWGIDAAASSVLALIKGGALSTTNAGILIFNSGIIPTGAWGSSYWTDIETAESGLYMSFGTPAGSIIYECIADVAAPFYTTEPGFLIKKLVYKAGVLFCIGAQVSAGKQFAAIYGIPLATKSPIFIAAPRKHKNTALAGWEAGCAGPDSKLFVADCNSGKIFTYDLLNDSLSLFDDLVNGGTGDGMSFISYANLLPYATATMETTTLALTGWTQTAGTVALATTDKHGGLNSISLASTSTASTATGTAGIPVAASTQYTAFIYSKAQVSTANITVSIVWYTVAGASISTSAGTPTADNAVTWTQVSVTATSPSNAAYATITVARSAVANVSWIDDASFHTGSGTTVTSQIAFLAMHGSRLFGATWQPLGTGTSLQVFTYDDLVKENRDASQAISASIQSGEWDFGVPQEQKALIGFYVTYEVTDSSTTSGLLANSQITVSYATDEDISVTPTYTALDTITSTTAVTQKGRHFIRVSDATATVKFGRLKMKLTLDNNATAVAPPIVYSVVVEAQLMAYAETWDLIVKVENEPDNDRPRSRSVDASFLRDNLLSLATNKNIVTFLDGARYPLKHGTEFSTHVVMVETPEDVIDENSEGFMALKLRSVPA